MVPRVTVRAHQESRPVCHGPGRSRVVGCLLAYVNCTAPGGGRCASTEGMRTVPRLPVGRRRGLMAAARRVAGVRRRAGRSPTARTSGSASTSAANAQRPPSSGSTTRCTSAPAIYHGDSGVLEAVDHVRALAGRYNVRELVYDPWRFGQAAQELEREGLLVVAFPQHDARMIPASARACTPRSSSSASPSPTTASSPATPPTRSPATPAAAGASTSRTRGRTSTPSSRSRWPSSAPSTSPNPSSCSDGSKALPRLRPDHDRLEVPARAGARARISAPNGGNSQRSSSIATGHAATAARRTSSPPITSSRAQRAAPTTPRTWSRSARAATDAQRRASAGAWRSATHPARRSFRNMMGPRRTGGRSHPRR